MTTLYSSIEAAEVRCSKPDHCKNCRKRHAWFSRNSKPVSLWSMDVLEMYWMCDLCGYCNNPVLYANKHTLHPLLTEAQSNAMEDARWEKNLTLKDIAAKTGISVSKLWDVECRRDAPTPDDWRAIKDALGMGRQDQP